MGLLKNKNYIYSSRQILHTMKSNFVCYHLFLLILIFSKAKSRPHGEICDGKCDEGLVCILEDTIFNPKTICDCPNDLDWLEGQCVDIKGQESAELAAFLSVIIPVSVSVIVTIICVIG